MSIERYLRTEVCPASGRHEAQRQIDLAGRELGAEGDPETAHIDFSTGNTNGKIVVVEFWVGTATSRVIARAFTQRLASASGFASSAIRVISSG